MAIKNRIIFWLENQWRMAFLGYKASMQPLKWQVFIMSSLLGPLFSMLFFISVRLGASIESDIDSAFLKGIFLIPMMTCVFYITFSISGDKYRHIFEIIRISPIGFLGAKLSMLVAAVIEIYTVCLFWWFFLSIIIFNFHWGLFDYFKYSLILLSACVSLACFGLLVAILLSKLKDPLMAVNSIYMILMIFSGNFYNNVNSFFKETLYFMLPLNYYVDITSVNMNNISLLNVIGVTIVKCFIYILILLKINE